MNLDKHATFLSFKGTDNIGKNKTTECIKASLMPCLISLTNYPIQNWNTALFVETIAIPEFFSCIVLHFPFTLSSTVDSFLFK